MAFKDFTESQQRAIRYLERVENAKNQADRNIDELRELNRVKDGLRASLSDGALSSEKAAPYVSICEKVEAKIDETFRENNEYLILRDKITRRIKKLRNPTYSLILQKRYLDFKTMETIAQEMNYSERRLNDLHKFALNAFMKVFDE